MEAAASAVSDPADGQVGDSAVERADDNVVRQTAQHAPLTAAWTRDYTPRSVSIAEIDAILCRARRLLDIWLQKVMPARRHAPFSRDQEFYAPLAQQLMDCFTVQLYGRLFRVFELWFPNEYEELDDNDAFVALCKHSLRLITHDYVKLPAFMWELLTAIGVHQVCTTIFGNGCFALLLDPREHSGNAPPALACGRVCPFFLSHQLPLVERPHNLPLKSSSLGIFLRMERAEHGGLRFFTKLAPSLLSARDILHRWLLPDGAPFGQWMGSAGDELERGVEANIFSTVEHSMEECVAAVADGLVDGMRVPAVLEEAWSRSICFTNLEANFGLQNCAVPLTANHVGAMCTRLAHMFRWWIKSAPGWRPEFKHVAALLRGFQSHERVQAQTRYFKQIFAKRLLDRQACLDACLGEASGLLHLSSESSEQYLDDWQEDVRPMPEFLVSVLLRLSGEHVLPGRVKYWLGFDVECYAPDSPAVHDLLGHCCWGSEPVYWNPTPNPSLGESHATYEPHGPSATGHTPRRLAEGYVHVTVQDLSWWSPQCQRSSLMPFLGLLEHGGEMEVSGVISPLLVSKEDAMLRCLLPPSSVLDFNALAGHPEFSQRRFVYLRIGREKLWDLLHRHFAGKSKPIRCTASDHEGTLKRKRMDERSYKFLDPCQIRFSQSSISPAFRNGIAIRDLVQRLIEAGIQKREVPCIRIHQHGGFWYTLDNRRLAAFRLLRMHRPDLCKVVKCEVSSPKEGEWDKKFSTKTEGQTVEVSRTRGLVVGASLEATTYCIGDGGAEADAGASSDSSAQA